jgi:hypothetical protein
MQSIYGIAKARVRTNYDMSETFPIEKGVLQGETVSPVLWDMYIEDLIEKLDSSDTMPIKILGGKIHALLYADDIIILAYTPAELQRKINVLRSFFQENELRINLGKTKYILFWKNKAECRACITWEQIKLERVDTYVYLGVPFSENMSFEKAKVHFIGKAEVAIKELLSVIYKSKMNTLESILHLYYSLVRSVLSYCSPVWGLKFPDELDKLRIKFIKSLFLLPRMTPDWFIRLELDLRTNELYFLKTCIKFWTKIRYKNKDSLVYKAYQSVKTTNEYQLNWYSQLEALCVKWNCSSVLNLGLEQDQYIGKISLNRALNLVNKHFKKVEDESISLDICKLRNTTFFSLYANNKTHCTQQAYLNDNNPMNVKKLILQLKLGVSHITHKGKVARLKHLEKFYNKTDSDKCDLCGREQEDTYHLLFVCPHFRSDR